MKKRILLFLILVLFLFISSSFAVDINLHPNNTTENQNVNNVTNNSTSNNNTSSDNAVTNRTTYTPAISTSDTTSRSDNNKLSLSDIIDIIVASIGIVNILLGIAIIIRFK